MAQLAYLPESPIDFFIKIVADYNIPSPLPGESAQFVVYRSEDVEFQVETINGSSFHRQVTIPFRSAAKATSTDPQTILAVVWTIPSLAVPST